MLGLGNLGRMVFGSANDRRIKRYQPTRRGDQRPRAEIAALSDAELQGEDRRRSASEVAEGTTLDDLLSAGLRHRPRGRQAHARPAAFRRAARRRHGAERRLDRRDEDRRRQDARRHPPRLSERARRQGRARRHRQRLSRPPRRGMDGPHLSVPRAFASASSCTASTRTQRRQAYAADVTYGTNNEFGFDYLRDNMEYSLQNMVQRGHYLRDRRRGGLHPGRRGADAAHHLRSDRGPLRALHHDRRADPAARRRRFRARREGALGELHRGRHREGRGHAAGGGHAARASPSTTSRTSPSSIT